MKTQKIITVGITMGAKVTHTIPSMMFNQTGIVIGYDGKKYGNHYFVVRYIDPLTNKIYFTPFWENVLILQ